MIEAHILSQSIGDAFFPLSVFLELQDAVEARDEESAETGKHYVIHSRPLSTGGWYPY